MEKEVDITKQCLVDDCIGFWDNFKNWKSDNLGGIYYSNEGLPDPDTYGNQLYDFHEKLWNIQRIKFQNRLEKNKYNCELTNCSDYEYNNKKSVGGQYARVLSNTDKSVRLGSDSIMSIYWHRISGKMPEIMKEISQTQSDYKEFIREYLKEANTIGGFVLFSRHSTSINQKRGVSSQIDDRFDLTLECIRRYYTKNPLYNPLSSVLEEDSEFFDMFGEDEEGFKNYAEFFCLNESYDGKHNWIENGHVLNLMNNEKLDEYDFSTEPLPQNSEEWWTFYKNIMNRLDARNEQIRELLGEKKS